MTDINILLEIDDTYHHAKGKDSFDDMDRIQRITRYNDLLKNEIAEKNQIVLVRIWHDEINTLHKILEENCI